MCSWVEDVECKEKFRHPRDCFVSIQTPLLSDFNYRGEREDVKDIAEFMRKFGADYSVLNVDLEQELLILVKTAEGDNIKNKPFLYVAQRQSAVQILCIPFQELTKVEEVIAPKVSHVKTIFLHSTGRCGSTLLCKALDQLPTLQSISEPDVHTVLALQYADNILAKGIFPNAHTNKETLVNVTRVATLLLNNYFLSCASEKTIICYKLRSVVTEGAELLQEAIPSAKTVYLYRNCLRFSESWIRVILEGSYAQYWLTSALRVDAAYLWYKICIFNESYYRYIGNTPENDNAPFRHGFYWCFIYFWWRNIEKAVALINADPDKFFHAVLRYEDLTTRKEELVLKVAKNLKLLDDSQSTKAEASVLTGIASVFKSNSQKGTGVSSKRDLEDKEDVWFGDWERQWINDVLQYVGHTVKNGDFVVPGTI